MFNDFSFNSEDFLQRSEHIGASSNLVWYLVLAVLAIWVIIFLLTAKGSAFLAKVGWLLQLQEYFLEVVISRS
jgi:hypothetical protein